MWKKDLKKKWPKFSKTHESYNPTDPEMEVNFNGNFLIYYVI